MSTAPESPAIAAQHNFSVAQRLYIWLACFFCSCLLIADIVGIKLFRIPLGFSVPVPWSDQPITAIEHTCGMITFPVTFLLTDLINEYYGKKGARRITWIGLTMGLFVFGIMNLAQYMPYLDAPFNVKPESFNGVFGSAKGMYIASMVAFLAGQMSDIAIFGLFKRLTGNRMIWLRSTGSTVISQFIDSFFVSFVAFYLLPLAEDVPRRFHSARFVRRDSENRHHGLSFEVLHRYRNHASDLRGSWDHPQVVRPCSPPT
jgi:queuosine precursor transporter